MPTSLGMYFQGTLLSPRESSPNYPLGFLNSYALATRSANTTSTLVGVKRTLPSAPDDTTAGEGEEPCEEYTPLVHTSPPLTLLYSPTLT